MRIGDQVKRRRTEKEWRKLVAAWRRSGAAAAEFAGEHGLVEGTLRWWAWRLGHSGRVRGGSRAVGSVSLVPVRISEDAGGGESEAKVAWTLHTSRGELRVRAGSDAIEALRVVIAALRDDP